METVIFNSDIARMVLGYLRKQRLDGAAKMFCKTSPYLEKEYEAIKQGYRLFEFKKELLENIIKEYCKIQTKVDKVIETMPPNMQENLQQKSLSSKVSILIHHCNLSAVNDQKESTSNKRKRESSDSVDCDIQFANDDELMRPPNTTSKRPRTSHADDMKNSKSFEVLSQSELDSGDDDSKDFDPVVSKSTSTPRLPSDKDTTVSSIPLQDISQALLDNQAFQEKLVTNINRALQTSSTTYPPSSSDAKKNEQNLMDELEAVVKNATEATEVDPIFDEFLQRVVSAQIEPSDCVNNIVTEDESQPATEPQPVQNTSVTVTNSSFGSLIDPNYSISKLIVLNSNESAQKNQPPEQIITTDVDGNKIVNATIENQQVYFDHTTGQLTCPLLLTSDGLLNLPFLINSELIQQLQNDVNLDLSRIEIPLPEPIIVSADQFPANAVIVRSTQKIDRIEDPTKAASVLPMGSNIFEVGTTPSTGILHSRSFKSLSTPRKKSSHVRTLNFSPLPGGRKLLKKIAPAVVEVEEPPVENPVIKTIEILSHCEVIPEADSENSNSLSNQTVIQKELVDTPKRKSRSKRVKRVLSKSEEVVTSSEPAPQEEIKEPTCESETKKVEINQIELNEWQKMRETSQTNFDYYLREINSKNPPQTKRVPPRRKKRRILGPGVSAATVSNRTRAKARQKAAKDKSLATASAKKKKKPETPSKSSFNIKIPTPYKNEVVATSSTKRNSKSSTSNETSQPEVVEEIVFIEPAVVPVVKLEEEREKRTANIACLLDTPFKSIDDQLLPPPTPGIVPSTLDTPIFKMVDSFRNLSDNILTPQFAITPGCTLTPFPKETPKSGAHQTQTDYSSGGSYYRPDESDDLDKIIDKQLRESAQKKKTETPTATPIKTVEVVEEKIPCEPVVLSRVKSFGDEVASEKPVDLHYTLAAGLPEITDDEEELANSAVSRSSSSSSSSCSSCSSCSSSSSSSSSSPSTVAKSNNLNTSIHDLSDISSTEDDDWKKDIPENEVAKVDDQLADEAPLVNNDWEVRYPVRSWLTPKKLEEPKVVEDKTVCRQKQLTDLELKKQRMKAKLSSDLKKKVPPCMPSTSKVRSPKKSLVQAAKEKVTSIRKQYVMSMVTTKEKKVMKMVTPLKIADVNALENSPPGPSSEQIDVLTALNLLSAKNRTPEAKNTQPQAPITTAKKTTLKKAVKTPVRPKAKVVNKPAIVGRKPNAKALKIDEKKSVVKPTPGIRQSKRSIRAPKALDCFSTQEPKKPTGPTRAATPATKKNPKVSQKTNINVPMEPVVVLFPLESEQHSEVQPPQQVETSQLLNSNEPSEVPKEVVSEKPKGFDIQSPIKLDSLKSSPDTLKSFDTVPDSSEGEDDDDEEDDNPLAVCERVVIDESDTKRFISFKYCGPDGPPAIPATSKKSVELNIFLNQHEKHCVKASEEFVLFSCQPKELSIQKNTTIRNIPKKRQVKLSSCENDSADVVGAFSSADEVRSTNRVEKASSIPTPQRVGGTDRIVPAPTLSSTPIVPTLKISQLQKAAASREQKKTEHPSCSSKTIAPKSKDDKKSPSTAKHKNHSQPTVSSSKFSAKESNPSTSNRFQENDIKLANKTSRTSATPPAASSSTAKTLPEAEGSTELPIDIDVILLKLHGKK